MIQIIGVILVTIVLLNHWNFWILAIGFIILIAPVTGVATLGFTIAMDESSSGRGSSSSLLGLDADFIWWCCIAISGGKR